MATEDRRARAALKETAGKSSPLEQRLFEESGRFAFDQATKLLQQMLPERREVGLDAPPGREAVRFRGRLGFDFPAGDIESLQKPDSARGGPAEMTVSAMGLAGYQGPLPMWLSELVADRSRRGDDTARDFLDLFNHRLISLLFRARRTIRPALTAGPGDDLELVRLLYALLGLGQEPARRGLPFNASRLLPFAGLFLPTPRSLVGLEQVLCGFFQAPVEASPLHGRWYRLEASQTTRLGPSGQNQHLGQGAVLGRRVWDQAAQLELRVGPLDFATFCQLLPTRPLYAAYQAMVRLYQGSEQQAELRLVLRAEELPRSHLRSLRPPPLPSGERVNGSFGLRLGWTSWLSTRPAIGDDEQVCLRMHAPGEAEAIHA